MYKGKMKKIFQKLIYIFAAALIVFYQVAPIGFSLSTVLAKDGEEEVASENKTDNSGSSSNGDSQPESNSSGSGSSGSGSSGSSGSGSGSSEPAPQPATTEPVPVATNNEAVQQETAPVNIVQEQTAPVNAVEVPEIIAPVVPVTNEVEDVKNGGVIKDAPGDTVRPTDPVVTTEAQAGALAPETAPQDPIPAQADTLVEPVEPAVETVTSAVNTITGPVETSINTTSVSSPTSIAGVVDQVNGFPSAYQDKLGIAVIPCLDGSDPNCVLPGAGEEEGFDPSQPTALGTNFPSEFFYWIAESEPLTTPNGGKTFIRTALEGAFLNEEPISTDQMVFGRIRVTGTGLEPNSTYIVTHPYGIDTYKTNDVGIIARGEGTEDIGCEVKPCDFTKALDSRIFDGFLQMSEGAPVGYLGDAATAAEVTGSPLGQNSYRIEGPGLPLGGLFTNLFTVAGKLLSGLITPISVEIPANQPAPVNEQNGAAGPIDDSNGFPASYQDLLGTTVIPCLDGSDPNCVLPGAGEEEGFDPSQPTALGTNFPSEFFYWIAESEPLTTPNGGKTFIRTALEGAFLNEEPISTDQMVFGRIRVTGTGLEPNSTYIVTHPYGIDTYKTNDVGIIARGEGTEDIGCEVKPCDFTKALDSRIFQSLLEWDVPLLNGYLGDAITPHTVMGSPTGNNFFRIEGPGLPIGGLLTNLFTVAGKLAGAIGGVVDNILPTEEPVIEEGTTAEEDMVEPIMDTDPADELIAEDLLVGGPTAEEGTGEDPINEAEDTPDAEIETPVATEDTVNEPVGEVVVSPANEDEQETNEEEQESEETEEPEAPVTVIPGNEDEVEDNNGTNTEEEVIQEEIIQTVETILADPLDQLLNTNSQEEASEQVTAFLQPAIVEAINNQANTTEDNTVLASNNSSAAQTNNTTSESAASSNNNSSSVSNNTSSQSSSSDNNQSSGSTNQSSGGIEAGQKTSAEEAKTGEENKTQVLSVQISQTAEDNSSEIFEQAEQPEQPEQSDSSEVTSEEKEAGKNPIGIVLALTGLAIAGGFFSRRFIV